MSVAEQFAKQVVTVRSGMRVPEVAERMAAEAVGCVVVTSDEGKPLGLLTDRDLLTRVIAAGRESGGTPAGAVMSHPLQSVDPDASLERALAVMCEFGVRRVPVLRDGELVGMVALNDVLLTVARDLRSLAEIPRLEIRSARRSQRLRELRSAVERLLKRGLAPEAKRLGEKAQSAVARLLETIRDRLKRRFS